MSEIEHEVEVTVSESEMSRIKAVAEQMGMSVDELATHAANAELRRRYVLQKKEGRVLALPVRKKAGA